MCNDTKEKVDIEFCENFSATVVDGNFYPFIRIVNNTGNIKRFSDCTFEYKTKDELQKVLKSNKIVILSQRAFDKLRAICIYRDEINPSTSLERAIGGVYVEYYSDSFWITNFKGYRQQVKIGKLLKAITNLNDTEISKCVDSFNRSTTYDLSIIKVTDDISWIYNLIHDSHGSVGGSCMKDCGNYFSALQNSSKDLSIAYITEDDTLIGRALLWNAYDGAGNSYKIMDRIYYNCEHTKILLEKYAEDNGYYFRKEASGYCTTFYNTKEKIWEELHLYVPLKYSLVGEYTPYMDTFRYYNKYKEYLYNFDSDYSYELTNTNGEAVCYTCDCCGSSVCDDCYYSDYHEERICDSCISDYRYVENRYDWIHYDSVTQLRDTNTYFLTDDVCDLVWVEDRGWYDYDCNVYFTVDTEEYYENTDELYYANDTGEWYYSNLNLYEYDGVYYSERQEELEQQQEEEK